MKNFQRPLAWITLLFAAFPALLSAQIGKQDLGKLQRMMKAEKLYVVIGPTTELTDPKTYFYEFREAFKDNWNQRDYEFISITDARAIGRDTNNYFLQLSHVFFNKRQGAMVLLTQGFRQPVIKYDWADYQRSALVQFVKFYVQRRSEADCPGHTCQKESFAFLIRAMQSYIRTAIEIEDARFEAVAWTNREKLKNTTWFVSKKSLSPEFQEEDALREKCPIDVKVVDLTKDDLLEDYPNYTATDIGIVHYANIYMSYQNWRVSIISMEGDLLYHLPGQKGRFAFIPKINPFVMERIEEWLAYETLEEATAPVEKE
ncbi:MAG: hypothetical protein ACFB10_07850 [Salibacteraceae bacterium]